VLAVQQDHIRAVRELVQRGPGGQAEGGGHAEGIDLLVAGRADGVGRYPVGQFRRELRAPLRRQALGVGQAAGRFGEARASDGRAHDDRARPRPASYLIDARDQPGTGRGDLALKRIARHVLHERP
jgi:hypothetical protein